MTSRYIYSLKKVIIKSLYSILFLVFIWIFFLKGMYGRVVNFDEIKIYQLSYNTGEKWFAILEPSSTIVLIKEFDVTHEVQVWNLKGGNSRHWVGPIYTPYSKYWPCIYSNAKVVWDIETHPEIVYSNLNHGINPPKNNNCTLIIYDESIQLCDKDFKEMKISKNEFIEFISNYNISEYVNSIP